MMDTVSVQEISVSAMKPNDCETCDFKKLTPSEGWCYMFKKEPSAWCIYHTVSADFTGYVPFPANYKEK